jgi:hypothetical protein
MTALPGVFNRQLSQATVRESGGMDDNRNYGNTKIGKGTRTPIGTITALNAELIPGGVICTPISYL